MENEMPGARGKVVAITGASSGIGEATALLLAGRGAKVMLGARRADRLKALAARIAAAGGDAAYAATDVTQRADLENLVARASERFGRSGDRHPRTTLTTSSDVRGRKSLGPRRGASMTGQLADVS
jgi:NAD(P)-dependent dehydrogenase (short-subunit alcohol dehydrogenase family)